MGFQSDAVLAEQQCDHLTVGDRIRARREAQTGVERTAAALWMNARDLKAMRADTPEHFDCRVMDDVVQAHKVLSDLINGVA